MRFTTPCQHSFYAFVSELENRTQKIRDMKKEIEEISSDDIAQEEEALQRLAEMVKSAAAVTNGSHSSGGDNDKSENTNGGMLLP